MAGRDASDRPERLADAHWAVLCHLSQATPRRRRLRCWLGTALIGAGLRLIQPLTVEVALRPSRASG